MKVGCCVRLTSSALRPNLLPVTRLEASRSRDEVNAT